MIIYYIGSNNKKKNITLNYYLNFNLHKYIIGTYYIILFNKNGSNYFIINNKISFIKNLIPKTDLKHQRKQCILLNNSDTVGTDLKILDNYKMNMCEDYNSITKLHIIFNLLKIRCTHINIIESKPFIKLTYDINEMIIDQLYK